MSKIMRVMALGLLAVALIACGKTPDEKTQDQAHELDAEQVSIRNALRKTGEPTTAWAEKDIKIYERRVDRLLAIEGALQAMNGKSGIRVKGSLMSEIRTRRDHLNAVRAQQRALNPTDPLLKEFNSLSGEYVILLLKFYLLGEPKKEWTETQRADYLAKVDKVIANIDEQIVVVKAKPDKFSGREEQTLNETKANLYDQRGKAVKFFSENEVKAPDGQGKSDDKIDKKTGDKTDQKTEGNDKTDEPKVEITIGDGSEKTGSTKDDVITLDPPKFGTNE